MKDQSLALSQIIDEVLTANDRPVSQIVQQCTNRINRMFSLNPEVKQRFLFNIGHSEELGVLRSWLLMEGYRDFFLPLLEIWNLSASILFENLALSLSKATTKNSNSCSWRSPTFTTGNFETGRPNIFWLRWILLRWSTVGWWVNCSISHACKLATLSLCRWSWCRIGLKNTSLNF